MAYSEDLADILRHDLSAHYADITEVKMFGGLLFKYRGHMLCGLHRIRETGEDGMMFRVGPDNYIAALNMDGVDKLTFTKSPMKGLVETPADIFDDNEKRHGLISMAIEFTSGLMPK